MTINVNAKVPAIYVRVSTNNQDTENQLPELLALARARGFEPHQVQVYQETQGASKDRPVWRRCLAACEAGVHSHLYLWAIDRCGRSMAGNLDTLLRLDALGVEVVSAREPWLQMKSPVRDLLIAIFSWVAQAEKQRISDRTRASLSRLKAGGKRLGRPPVQIPLSVARDLIDHQGLSVRAASKKLRCSATTLTRILKAQMAPATAPETVVNAPPAPKGGEVPGITRAA